MSATLPELWTDWCCATDRAADRIDTASLRLFAHQARPSKVVLTRLRQAIAPDLPAAPAWPREHRDDPASLHRLLGRVDVMIRDRPTRWALRLRLRRMLFAAVLVAPVSHGGLAMSRTQVRNLRPARLRELRTKIGVAESPAECPACAVWSWLEIIGANYTWSRGGVRSLTQHRDENSEAHRHELADPSPEWQMCLGMLPAIDRWGWVDTHSSLHPASLSVVLRAARELLDGPLPVPSPEPEPQVPVRELSEEEREAIFARADEVMTRVEAILNEFS